jgi:hypothetical protein
LRLLCRLARVRRHRAGIEVDLETFIREFEAGLTRRSAAGCQAGGDTTQPGKV